MTDATWSPAVDTIRKCSRALRLDSLPVWVAEVLLVSGGFALVVASLAAWEPLGGVVTLVLLAVVASQRPGWILGLAFSGTFVYLGALELAGRTPHTLATASFDAMLGALLLVVVWTRRRLLLQRLRSTAI